MTTRKITDRNRIQKQIKIATWNVRSMKREKLHTVITEAQRYNINILGLAESRWAGSGHFSPAEGGTVMFSGSEKGGQAGVAFYVDKKTEKAVLGYNPVSDRIITLRIKGRQNNISIIQVYAPTSVADEESIDNFYNKLQDTIDGVKKEDILIVMGDLNAKVGKNNNNETNNKCVGKFGLGERNDRGEKLEEFAIENNLAILNTMFEHHVRRLYTWTSPDSKYKNQIDYIMIHAKWRTSIRNTKTLPGADCETDHELLMADMKIKLKYKKETTNVSRYDTTQITEEYTVEVTNKFNSLLEDIESREPEEIAECTKNIFKEAAEKHLKKKERLKQTWITQDTLEKIQERRKVKKMRNNKEEKEKYKRLSKEIKLMCKADKSKYIKDKCEQIEKYNKQNNSRDMFKEIKKLTNTFQPVHRVIKDDKGRILTETDDIKDRWKRYCESMYTSNNLAAEENTTKEEIEEDQREPLKSEVEWAINNLKQGKSPGIDNITAEMIQASGEAGIKVYYEMCKKIWNTGQWPTDWKRAVFIPIPKKGDTQDCSNYRTISLISHASKILLKILMKRIQTKLEEELKETQAGFRKGRGTTDHIFNLKMMIEKCREFNRDLYICFIDYSKAFDCVEHEKLWRIMTEMNFPHQEVQLIKTLYQGQQSAVRTSCGMTEWFPVQKGVRQGCILSPYLFNIYTEDIMREVEKDNTENSDDITINGEKITELRYADDTALISGSTTGLEKLITSVKEHSEEKGLFLNVRKTKIMKTDKTTQDANVSLGNETIENVNQFQYLGAMIYGNGDDTQEIRRRLAMGLSTLTKLQKLWKGSDRDTKLRTIRTCVFSTATYGCETWILNNAMKNKISAFEMKCYRKMMRIHWAEKRTNKSILQELKLEEGWLLKFVLRQKLRYFGHIKRHQGLEKTILEGKLEGKRDRGRPHRRWIEDITQTLHKSATEIGRLAEHRVEYRAIIRDATSSKDMQ